MRSMTSPAMSAHSVSLRARSPGALRSEQCQTHFVAELSAARGAFNLAIRGRKSRRPLAVISGSTAPGSSHPATTRGLVCSLGRPGPNR